MNESTRILLVSVVLRARRQMRRRDRTSRSRSSSATVATTDSLDERGSGAPRCRRRLRDSLRAAGDRRLRPLRRDRLRLRGGVAVKRSVIAATVALAACASTRFKGGLRFTVPLREAPLLRWDGVFAYGS